MRDRTAREGAASSRPSDSKFPAPEALVQIPRSLDPPRLEPQPDPDPRSPIPWTTVVESSSNAHALPPQVKPRINKTQTGVETAGVRHSMNPFDELSVEQSVATREKKLAPGGVEDICVISAGPAKAQETLRTAMAMGADRGIHIEVKEGDDLEPLTVAKLLKAAAEQQKSNLVILGKQSIDDDSAQTGQMLAGLLGWPQATQASKVEFGAGDVVNVTREVDGGVETVRAKLPMVITTDLRLNTPRYATLPNIMKAKKKPLEKKTLADFGITAEKRLKVLSVNGEFDSSPPPKPRSDPGLTRYIRTPCEARRRQGRGRGWPDFQAQGARRYLDCHCIQHCPPCPNLFQPAYRVSAAPARCTIRITEAYEKLSGSWPMVDLRVYPREAIRATTSPPPRSAPSAIYGVLPSRLSAGSIVDHACRIAWLPWEAKTEARGARGATRGTRLTCPSLRSIQSCMTHPWPAIVPTNPQCAAVSTCMWRCRWKLTFSFAWAEGRVVRSRNRARPDPAPSRKMFVGSQWAGGPVPPCVCPVVHSLAPPPPVFRGMGLAGIPANGRPSNWLRARPLWSPAPAAQSTFSLFFLWALDSRLFVSSLSSESTSTTHKLLKCKIVYPPPPPPRIAHHPSRTPPWFPPLLIPNWPLSLPR